MRPVVAIAAHSTPGIAGKMMDFLWGDRNYRYMVLVFVILFIYLLREELKPFSTLSFLTGMDLPSIFSIKTCREAVIKIILMPCHFVES